MSLEVHTISPKKFLPKINDSYEHNVLGDNNNYIYPEMLTCNGECIVLNKIDYENAYIFDVYFDFRNGTIGRYSRIVLDLINLTNCTNIHANSNASDNTEWNTRTDSSRYLQLGIGSTNSFTPYRFVVCRYPWSGLWNYTITLLNHGVGSMYFSDSI